MARKEEPNLKFFDCALTPKARHKGSDCNLVEMRAERRGETFSGQDVVNGGNNKSTIRHPFTRVSKQEQKVQGGKLSCLHCQGNHVAS